MSFVARSFLAAVFLAGLAGAAHAQVYGEPITEPMVEWSGPAPAPSTYDRHAYRHARVARIATPHAETRVYAAPALPPVRATAYTVPTRVIYAEPTPRTVYYNEPVIIDGLRAHRAARRVMIDPCGHGCVRAAY